MANTSCLQERKETECRNKEDGGIHTKIETKTEGQICKIRRETMEIKMERETEEREKENGERQTKRKAGIRRKVLPRPTDCCVLLPQTLAATGAPTHSSGPS